MQETNTPPQPYQGLHIICRKSHSFFEHWDVMSERKAFLVAIASRSVILLLTSLLHGSLPDYDTSGELVDHGACNSAIREVVQSPNCVERAVKGLIVWDSIYFVRIARCGYEYEQYHAFFPGYPGGYTFAGNWNQQTESSDSTAGVNAFSGHKSFTSWNQFKKIMPRRIVALQPDQKREVPTKARMPYLHHWAWSDGMSEAISPYTSTELHNSRPFSRTELFHLNWTVANWQHHTDLDIRGLFKRIGSHNSH